MGKYTPLRTFLKTQDGARVAMTFRDVETLLGFSLPASKQYPAWWSNNPSNNPMTAEWLAAGFRTEQVDTEGERLVFVRANELAAKAGFSVGRRHPLFGRTKGLGRLAEGVDLTKPADPEWGKVYE
ncbi:YD repeat-containing protein [Breoghania corrubedonensis]|uniref:YD repeat-containing protein n=1 Tax=Breoghania corrubedonensis TaxID=665038 RepID=A0A2T5VDY9_9HYPH|nr:hypothetical protein [Breoghania corrubedonensis]PTW61972.1 YD repeat-containing protein [Breoghania corrubedonensis]